MAATTAGASTEIRNRRVALVVLCLGVLMIQADTSVVNLAVHAIGVALHAPLATLQWTVDGYNLTYTLFLMSGGTLADLYGRRQMLRLGAGLFTLGAAVSGLAPDAAMLVSGRVVAGLGAALLVPSSLALIRVIWTDSRERAHAIGIWAGMNGAAFVFGPTLGGLLIAVSGWRSVFLLIIPIGLAVWILAPRIPESADPLGRRLDLPGQLLAGLGLGGLALAAIGHGELAVVSAIVGGICVGGFVWVEHRAGDGAMMPLMVFRHRALIGAITVAAAMTFGMYGVLFLLPLMWLRFHVLDVAQAGAALMPMSIAFVALSHRSGAWSHRVGARAMMASGMALIGVGITILALTDAGRPLALAELGLLLTGIGMALNTGPLLAVAVAAVEPSRAGTASALVNTARMVGATFGVAVLGAVYAKVGNSAGFALAMCLGGLAAFLGVVLAVKSIHV